MKPNSTEIQPLELFSFQDLQEALREKIGENWKELGWKYAGDGSSRVRWGKYQFELFYEEGLDRLGKDKCDNNDRHEEEQLSVGIEDLGMVDPEIADADSRQK